MGDLGPKSGKAVQYSLNKLSINFSDILSWVRLSILIINISRATDYLLKCNNLPIIFDLDRHLLYREHVTKIELAYVKYTSGQRSQKLKCDYKVTKTDNVKKLFPEKISR
jgi:hypothetical protein